MNNQKTTIIIFGLSLTIMLLTMNAVNVSLAMTPSKGSEIKKNSDPQSTNKVVIINGPTKLKHSQTQTCNGQTVPRGAGHCAKLPSCDTITIGSCRDEGDISSPPITQGQTVQKTTASKSGFSHGLHDGADSCLHPDGCHWYILQPGKGFSFHTAEFNKAYIAGFCKSNPTGGSDGDDATFSCN